MYLGHLPNASPVQRHSAGETFPYVLVAVEPLGQPRYWTIIGNGIVRGLGRYATHRDAERVALLLKAGSVTRAEAVCLNRAA